MTEVKLNRIDTILDGLDYPISKQNVINEIGDVNVILAEGEAKLGSVVRTIDENEFRTADDLESEIYSNLPIEAVGEPGQSEGDA